MTCSIARTLEIVGEWWTPLILREAFLGTRRFEDFQRNLGLARNVLTTRLQSLVRTGILERSRYQEHPQRYEYHLTERGLELFPILAALMRWGDHWAADVSGAPMVLVHEPCGHDAQARLVCSHCGGDVTAETVRPEPGPGARRTG